MSDFSFLSKFNIVWTLHDSWPFTGGCHIPYDCNKYKNKCFSCEQLKKNSLFDLSKVIWENKEKYYKNLKMNIVVPSKWMAECAKKSALFKEKEVNVIANGINIQTYKPIDKNVVRNIIGINQEKK